MLEAYDAFDRFPRPDPPGRTESRDDSHRVTPMTTRLRAHALRLLLIAALLTSAAGCGTFRKCCHKSDPCDRPLARSECDSVPPSPVRF